MPPVTKIQAFALILRVLLGAMFAYTGGEKLFRLDTFARDIANYHMVSPQMGAWVALVLPSLELLVAVCLLLGCWARAAVLWAIGLTLMFMGAIGWAWARGLDISCGCFGSTVKTNYPLHMAGLVGMLLALIFVWIQEKRPSALVG